MSQSQEIRQIYDRLNELNPGINVEDLVYAPGGYLYSEWPEEWNNAGFSKVFYPGVVAPVAPYQVGKDKDFNGNIVYCERLWNDFKYWLMRAKGIFIKGPYDALCEARGLPLSYTIKTEEIPEDFGGEGKDYGDFCSEYLTNKYGYLMRTAYYELDTQGNITMKGIEWELNDEDLVDDDLPF